MVLVTHQGYHQEGGKATNHHPLLVDEDRTDADRCLITSSYTLTPAGDAAPSLPALPAQYPPLEVGCWGGNGCGDGRVLGKWIAREVVRRGKW